MKDIFEQIISLNIEIEGLMRVARDRDALHAIDNARSKLEVLNNLFAQLPSHHTETIVKECEAEGAEESPLEEPDEFDIPADAVIVESDEQAEIPGQAVEEADAEAAEYQLIVEPEPVVESEPAIEPEPVVKTEPVAKPIPAPAAPIALGDIRKSMTLNDKFLFRRELFGGSDAEFNDTLDLLTSMDSLDEAEEYMYHDLQWDPENPVVADFMTIIATHFRKP